MSEFFGDLIYSYTRAQAIADGVLIDVTETARECGFKVPVALTRAVWADCVEWRNPNDRKPPQDEAGRLWDVLSMASLAASRDKHKSRVIFGLIRVPLHGRGIHPAPVRLAMEIGPGDDGAPVITIMQLGED